MFRFSHRYEWRRATKDRRKASMSEEKITELDIFTHNKSQQLREGRATDHKRELFRNYVTKYENLLHVIKISRQLLCHSRTKRTATRIRNHLPFIFSMNVLMHFLSTREFLITLASSSFTHKPQHSRQFNVS